MRIAFGLGSNMGDSATLLKQANCHLAKQLRVSTDDMLSSPIYETPPLLPKGAPETWNKPFLNQVTVIDVDTLPKPLALLETVKSIEANLGRIDRGHWSPREIDIDLIAVEGTTHHSKTLTIPHSEAHKRLFVLQPLCDLWPECVLQGGLTATQALSEINNI